MIPASASVGGRSETAVSDTAVFLGRPPTLSERPDEVDLSDRTACVRRPVPARTAFRPGETGDQRELSSIPRYFAGSSSPLAYMEEDGIALLIALIAALALGSRRDS